MFWPELCSAGHECFFPMSSSMIPFCHKGWTRVADGYRWREYTLPLPGEVQSHHTPTSQAGLGPKQGHRIRVPGTAIGQIRKTLTKPYPTNLYLAHVVVEE